MIPEIVWVILLPFLAGSAAAVGGILAYIEAVTPGRMNEDLLHGIIAFGGGIILAAVALVLVPEGIAGAGVGGIVIWFGSGAIVFFLIDRAIERRGGHAAQFMGMAMDYIPESIGLGAAFALGGDTGPLLAIFIALQNLPEGFNAFRETVKAGVGRARVLGLLAALSFLGPVGAVAGYLAIEDFPWLLSAVFLFASGGIVYLVFHDIAPLAHRKGHWMPTLGACFGFLVGMVGDALVRG